MALNSCMLSSITIHCACQGRGAHAAMIAKLSAAPPRVPTRRRKYWIHEKGSRKNTARRYPQFNPKRGLTISFMLGIVWNIKTVVLWLLPSLEETKHTTRDSFYGSPPNILFTKSPVVSNAVRCQSTTPRRHRSILRGKQKNTSRSVFRLASFLEVRSHGTIVKQSHWVVVETVTDRQ